MKAHIEDIEDTHICRVLLSIYYIILYTNNFPCFFRGKLVTCQQGLASLCGKPYSCVSSFLASRNPTLWLHSFDQDSFRLGQGRCLFKLEKLSSGSLRGEVDPAAILPTGMNFSKP